MSEAASKLDLACKPKQAGGTCGRCSLNDLCLPRNLSDEETSQFEQIVERAHPVHAGTHLFRAGEPFTSVAAVRSGCFKSYLIDRQGVEKVTDFHLPGDLIGLDAIYASSYLSSCVALDTGAVCTLRFGSVSALARRITNLQSEILSLMSERIANLEVMCNDFSAERRLALFLDSISKRYSKRGYSDKEFNLPISRRDLANYLRLAVETVSRVLGRLKSNGVLDVSGKRFRILDQEALREIASGQRD